MSRAERLGASFPLAVIARATSPRSNLPARGVSMGAGCSGSLGAFRPRNDVAGLFGRNSYHAAPGLLFSKAMVML